MKVIPKPMRLFYGAQVLLDETSRLSMDYSIELANDESLAEADSLYQVFKESTELGADYFSDYLNNVESLVGDTYCDTKYLIRDSSGSIIGYLGLETTRKQVLDFAHIPLVNDYDPMITLLIKMWFYEKSPYDRVYYTMRYGYAKVPPIDKYLEVLCLGRVDSFDDDSKAQHTYTFKTKQGGGLWHVGRISQKPSYDVNVGVDSPTLLPSL